MSLFGGTGGYFWLDSESDETMANALLILIARVIHMLNRQMETQGETFKEEGGFREKLTGIMIATLLAAVSVHAGSGTAQSGEFRVDTRAAVVVKVTGVTSRYCDGAYGGTGRHVYFPAGRKRFWSFPWTSTVTLKRGEIRKFMPAPLMAASGGRTCG